MLLSFARENSNDLSGDLSVGRLSDRAAAYRDHIALRVQDQDIGILGRLVADEGLPSRFVFQGDQESVSPAVGYGVLHAVEGEPAKKRSYAREHGDAVGRETRPVAEVFFKAVYPGSALRSRALGEADSQRCRPRAAGPRAGRTMIRPIAPA